MCCANTSLGLCNTNTMSQCTGRHCLYRLQGPYLRNVAYCSFPGTVKMLQQSLSTLCEKTSYWQIKPFLGINFPKSCKYSQQIHTENKHQTRGWCLPVFGERLQQLPISLFDDAFICHYNACKKAWIRAAIRALPASLGCKPSGIYISFCAAIAGWIPLIRYKSHTGNP